MDGPVISGISNGIISTRGSKKGKADKSYIATSGESVNDVATDPSPSLDGATNTTRCGDLAVIDGTLRIKDETPVGGKKVLELFCRTQSEVGDEIENYTSRFEENNEVSYDGRLVSKRQFEESASKSCLATQDDGSEVVASSELRHKEDEKVTKSHTGKILAEYSVCSEEVHEQTTCTYETVGDQVKKTAHTKRRGSVSSSTRREGDEMAAIEACDNNGKIKDKFIVSFNSDTSDSDDGADVSVSFTLTLPNGNVDSDTSDKTKAIENKEESSEKQEKKDKKTKKSKKEENEDILKASDSELKKEKKSKKKDKEKEKNAGSSSERGEEPEVTKEKKKKKKDKDKDKDKEAENEITEKIVSETLDIPRKEKKHKKKDKEKYSGSEQESTENSEKKSIKSKKADNHLAEEQEKGENVEIISEKADKKSKKKEKKSKDKAAVLNTDVVENACSIDAKIDSSCDEPNATSFNFAAAFTQSVSESTTKTDSFGAHASKGSEISGATRKGSGISVETKKTESSKCSKEYTEGKTENMDALIVHTESIDLGDASDDDASVSTETSTGDEMITFENTSDLPITINVEYDADGNIFVSDQDAERLGMNVEEVISVLGLQNECKKISDEMSQCQTTTTTESSTPKASEFLSTDGSTATGSGEVRKQVEHIVTSPKLMRRSNNTTTKSVKPEDSSEDRQIPIESQTLKDIDSKLISPRVSHSPSTPVNVTSPKVMPQPSVNKTDTLNEDSEERAKGLSDNFSEFSNVESQESAGHQQVTNESSFSVDKQSAKAQSQEKKFAQSEQADQSISLTTDASSLSEQEEHAGTENYIKQAISSSSESNTRVVSQQSSDERFYSRQEALTKSDAIGREFVSENQQEKLASSSEGYVPSVQQRSAGSTQHQQNREPHYLQTSSASQPEIDGTTYSNLSSPERKQIVTGAVDESYNTRRNLATPGNSASRVETDGYRVRVETGGSTARESQNNSESGSREARLSRQNKMAEEENSQLISDQVEYNDTEHNLHGTKNAYQGTSKANVDAANIMQPQHSRQEASARDLQNGFHEKPFEDELELTHSSEMAPNSAGRGRLIGQGRVMTGDPETQGDQSQRPRTRAEDFELDSAYVFDRTSTDDLIKRILGEDDDEDDDPKVSPRLNVDMGGREHRNQTSRYRHEEEEEGEEKYIKRSQQTRKTNSYDEDVADTSPRQRRMHKYDDDQGNDEMHRPLQRRRMHLDNDEAEGEAYLDRAAELRQRQRNKYKQEEEEDYHVERPQPKRRTNRFEDDEDDDIGRGGRYGEYHDDEDDEQEPSLLERRLASMGLNRKGSGRGGYQKRGRYDEMESQGYEETRKGGRSMMAYNTGDDGLEGRRRSGRRQKQPYEDEALSAALRPKSYKNPYLDQYSSEEDEPQVQRKSRKAIKAYIPEQEFIPHPRPETREVVAEKTEEIRGVIDRQESVLKKLKYASHSFEDLDEEIREIKEAFFESVVRKARLLDDMNAFAAELPHFEEETSEPQYRTKYGRALALRRSMSAIEYPAKQVAARNLALDKLDKDIASEPTKIGKGALHHLARKEGFKFNKVTGEYEELVFDKEAEPKRNKYEEFEDEDEEEWDLRSGVGKYSSYFDDDDDDSTFYSSYKSRRPILGAIDTKPYHSTHVGVGSYRNKYARRASFSGMLAIEAPRALEDDEDSLSTHSAEGYSYTAGRSLRANTDAKPAFKSRFLNSSISSSATDRTEGKSSSTYADIKAKYGLSSESSNKYDRGSSFGKYGLSSDSSEKSDRLSGLSKYGLSAESSNTSDRLSGLGKYGLSVESSDTSDRLSGLGKYGLSAESSDTSERVSSYAKYGRANTIESLSSIRKPFEKPEPEPSSRFLNKVRQRRASGESLTRDKPFKSRFLNKTIEATSDSSTAATTTNNSNTDTSGTTE